MPEKKANFSKTLINKADGTSTVEVKDLNKNEIISSKSYKNGEPYGIWKLPYNKENGTLDYNFPLVYSDEDCNDSLAISINNYFMDNDSLNYKAPVISSGEQNIYGYIAKKMHYPELAMDNGIEGTVVVKIIFSKDGSIDEIAVRKGVQSYLDREAVRVLRELKLESPPTINGKVINLDCITIPVSFRLSR